MKKVIVFGAAGFIGNAVVSQLLSKGVEVLAVIRPNTLESAEAFRVKNLECKIIECELKNINMLPEIISERNFDAFYQFAWDGTDKSSIVDYQRQIQNIAWGLDSIRVAQKLGCRKYIGAGSITQKELLCKTGRFFVEERHKYFRAAQFTSEIMGRAYAKEIGIDFFWPIIINVYGEGEIASRLVNTTIKSMLKGEGQEFSAGEQLYDFLHIEDAARAFILIGEKGKTNSEYVIGSGQPRKLKEYLTELHNIVAPQTEISFGKLQFSGLEMSEEMLDITALKQDTGFIPQISFAEGITTTMKWLIERDEN